jgi:hypothetical protein
MYDLSGAVRFYQYWRGEKDTSRNKWLILLGLSLISHGPEAVRRALGPL